MKFECEFCKSKNFERWEGSNGLEGIRCKDCKAWSSYVIFQEFYHQLKPKRSYDKKRYKN